MSRISQSVKTYIFALMLASAIYTQTVVALAQGVQALQKTEVSLVEKEVSVPIPPALQLSPGIEVSHLSHGLDAVEVYYKTANKLPVALLTHGTPEFAAERAHVTPWAFLEQARWFARRGYFVIVVVRTGYGRSGGFADRDNGDCGVESPQFSDIASVAADDLRLVVDFVRKLPQVDPTRMISVGVSTGGYAQLALVADPPRGLKAAIDFAGGIGHDGDEHNCDLPVAMASFKGFGKSAHKHGNLPTLWVFAQNDHWYPPSMAQGFEQAYRNGGGASQFVLAPPHGTDGHDLFFDVPAWSDIVQAFLKGHDLLPLGDMVLPLPDPPDIPMPKGLSEVNSMAWGKFLLAAPYKSLAVDDHGVTSTASGEFDQPAADHDAMEQCRKAKGGRCAIVARTNDQN